MKASKKTRGRKRILVHRKIRKKISGTESRPRLSVNFTGQHIYAQLVDDQEGKTIAAVSTTEKAIAGDKVKANVNGATKVGELLAKRAKEKKIETVVFDRGGFKYHGKVKALAEAAREGGLTF